MNLHEPSTLKVRLNEVIFEREVKPLKVMATGDWHVSPIVSERQFEFLRQAIKTAKPDLIVLQGDLVDSPVELKRETSLKKLIRELKLCANAAPTVLVLGGHDYVTPTRPAKNLRKFALPRWEALCKKCGVKLLMNEWFTEVPGIRVFGAFQDERCMLYNETDGKKAHKDNPEGFSACLLDAEPEISEGYLDPEEFGGVNWFAAHAPLLNQKVIAQLTPFDIASFGHTHGGIVPRGMDEILEKFDLHFGLISPNLKPFPSQVRGVMPISDTTMMVVNPGMIGAHFCVSKPLQNMNFVKAAEINVIDIKNGGADRN